MTITHTTVATGINNDSKQVSVNAWNEAHTGTNEHGHTGTDDGGVLNGYATTGDIAVFMTQAQVLIRGLGA